jgi:hypothetical protein
LPDEEALSVTDHPYTLPQELDLGLELADLADQIVTSHFKRDGYAFENKYDGSPVTAIDRAVEQAIRDLVAVRRPGYGVFGEEGGLGPDDPDTPLPRKAVGPRGVQGPRGRHDYRGPMVGMMEGLGVGATLLTALGVVGGDSFWWSDDLSVSVKELAGAWNTPF